MNRLLASLALCCLTGMLPAAHAASQLHDFRASLLVNGTISVSDAGTVTGYTLDQPGKLPKVVVDMLQRAIPTWRFHPAERGGHPVDVTAKMHARLVATPAGGHRFRIRLAGTSFDDGLPRSRQVHFDGPQRPPVYPRLARMEHVSGTVYVVLRINRRGGIDKMAVQEVDLTSRGGPAETVSSPGNAVWSNGNRVSTGSDQSRWKSLECSYAGSGPLDQGRPPGNGAVA